VERRGDGGGREEKRRSARDWGFGARLGAVGKWWGGRGVSWRVLTVEFVHKLWWEVNAHNKRDVGVYQETSKNCEEWSGCFLCATRLCALS
jgi:hypothetical protein